MQLLRNVIATGVGIAPRFFSAGARGKPSPPARALAWVRFRESSSGGIAARSDSTSGQIGATGALLPTILRYGERELAGRCLRWLVDQQHSSGHYYNSTGNPSRLETCLALQGLIAGSQTFPDVVEATRRASEYLWRELGKRRTHEIQTANSFRESRTHFLMLSTLHAAAHALREPKYLPLVESCLDDAIRNDLSTTAPTDGLVCRFAALIELNRPDCARSGLDRLRERQHPNGAITATPDVRWVSSSGLAQLAWCWHKIGEWEAGDQALAWLEKHQRRSGGFFSQYGATVLRFSGVESASTAKWYLDAHHLRVQSAMARYPLASEVSQNDGRLRAIANLIKSQDRVIEVGCGKGRFLQAITQIYPGVKCTGVDITPSLLAEIPREIETREGSLECVPYPDDSFDVTFSVEAIEHSANWAAAVRELTRIARPGGWIVIIDKQRSQWGRLECMSWESWPDAKVLADLLEQYCNRVTYESVGYDGEPPDGLMLAWKGRKRIRSGQAA